MFEKFGCAAVVTGGHLPGKEVVEIFYDGREELLLVSPRVKGDPCRGTGCRFSAAVTAGLAKGEKLAPAVQLATEWVSSELVSSE